MGDLVEVERVLRCWGKTTGQVDVFHPALFHMIDVGNVAAVLLSESCSGRWRTVLSQTTGIAMDSLVSALPWLVAIHDIGKVSSAFQVGNPGQLERLQHEGFDLGVRRVELHHTLVGQAFASSEWASASGVELPGEWASVWREVIGGHHGRFAPPGGLKEARVRIRAYEPLEWAALRSAASVLLERYLCGGTVSFPDKPANVSASIMALTGFTILCDWIGSNQACFTPADRISLEDYVERSVDAARRALDDAGFTQCCTSHAAVEFGSLFADIESPRPLQRSIDDIPDRLLSGPCLAIIEAPTGEGKTEASLALAHRIAQARGTDELYYALPTTATSNQMFQRVQSHIRDRLQLSAQVKLVHGQAFLVEDDLRLEMLADPESEPDAAMTWFSPKKRALLAPFGVGTIDQAELAALNVPHVALRLVGLAGKTLILDEVHAYDTYMTTIVERLLNWMSSLGTSVILLSATLPLAQRRRLAEAFGAEVPDEAADAVDYPSLLVTGPHGTHHAFPQTQNFARRLALEHLHIANEAMDEKARWLLDATAHAGCVCWICNTVDRAQRLYEQVRALASAEVDCLLLHARFPLEDRQSLEHRLTAHYGRCGDRPQRGIVIGTQVLEQSLDVDFDVMVSDIAPVDLLLQRAGRLHRHQRPRPLQHGTPCLRINTEMAGDGGPELTTDRRIYAELILRRTWLALAQRTDIDLPADYRALIEAVYAAAEPSVDSPLRKAWEQLRRDSLHATQEARLRLLPEPDPEEAFCAAASQLSFQEDENSAAWVVAQTRLGAASLNVIPLERLGDRVFLPSGQVVPVDAVPDRVLQLALLRRGLRISHPDVIAALRAANATHPCLFSTSPLLQGQAPLWLSGGRAQLAGERGAIELVVEPELGLVIRRKGE